MAAAHSSDHTADGAYHRGAMDIAEQKKTWNGFMTASMWVSALVGASVLILSMVFGAGIAWPIATLTALAGTLIAGALLGRGAIWYVVFGGLGLLVLGVGGLAQWVIGLLG